MPLDWRLRYEARVSANAEAGLVRALWTLSRPKGMLFVSFLPMVGYAFAFWDHGCEDPSAHPFGILALLALAWAVPHAGTMWLNAGLDRDEKPTLFGESVAVPKHIALFAYPTFAFAIALGFWLSIGTGICVILCSILSILYSHKAFAWKAHAYGGPFANLVGYGALSPIGGFLVAGFAPTMRGALVLVIAMTWILSAYFAAQAFQFDEDNERGYRTLVVVKGPAFTLTLTTTLYRLAALGTLALAAAGWFPRVVLVALPGFIWVDFLLRDWRKQPKGGDVSWAKKFFIRLFIVSLVVLVFVCFDYEWRRSATGMPGGLATMSGHDEPRACDGTTLRRGDVWW